jgi:hypothetical protein
MIKKIWSVGKTNPPYTPLPPKPLAPLVNENGPDAKPFTPHDFKTEIRIRGKIEIRISRKAYSDMLLFVGLCVEEIGWLGTVKRDKFTFTIEEVFLTDQNVHGSETDITTEGMTYLAEELMDRPDFKEAWDSVRFWGHSHVHGGTNPSPQDQEQLAKLMSPVLEADVNQFFIRGIMNKLGRMEFTLFLLGDPNLIILDVPWQIDDPQDSTRAKQIADLIKARVARSKTYQTHYPRSDQWDDEAYYHPHGGEIPVGGYEPVPAISPKTAEPPDGIVRVNIAEPPLRSAATIVVKQAKGADQKEKGDKKK